MDKEEYKMRNPLISIIVPCYNVEKYLDKCVESLVNQTYTNLEIWLVDDGAKDATPQLCDKWAKKDDRIRVIHKTNGGVSSARNAGLDICVGEWLMMPDSDDWYELNAIERMLELALENDAEVLGVNCNYCYDKKKVKRGAVVPEIVARSGDDLRWFKYDMMFPYMDEKQNGVVVQGIRGVNSKLYRTSVINGGVPIRFNTEVKIAEDALFNYDVLCRVKTFVITNEYFYNYRKNDASVMNKYNPNIFDINEKSLQAFTDKIKDEDDENYKIAYTGFAAECIFRAFKLNLLNDGNPLTLKEKIYSLTTMLQQSVYQTAFNEQYFEYLPNGKRQIVNKCYRGG